jgi:hypothetical protein
MCTSGTLFTGKQGVRPQQPCKLTARVRALANEHGRGTEVLTPRHMIHNVIREVKPRTTHGVATRCVSISNVQEQLSRRQSPRVVVIGASLAGLLAAAAVSDFVDEVVVLDKDAALDQSASLEDLQKVAPNIYSEYLSNSCHSPQLSAGTIQ